MVAFYRLPAARLAVASLLLMSLLCGFGVWLGAYHVKFVGIGDALSNMLGLLIIMAATGLAINRLQGDGARSAKAITYTCGAIYDLSAVAIVFIYFGCIIAPLFCALAASAGFPMQDAALVWVDKALGFDWEWFVGTLNSSPLLVSALIFSYKSLAWTVPVCVGYFILGRRSDELWTLTALMIFAAMLTISTFCFVPVVGAFTYFGVDNALAGEFTRQWPGSGTFYVSGLLDVHSNQSHTLDLSKINGIVQFPSYHSIVAIILMYMMRNERVMCWPFVAINIPMIIATVPCGSHYVCDTLGSIVVVAVSVIVLDTMKGTHSPRTKLQSSVRRAAALVPGNNPCHPSTSQSSPSV